MCQSEWCEFPSARCLARKRKLDDSSRLDVVEIARVPDMLPSLFPSWSAYRLISKPVLKVDAKLTVFVPSAILVSAVTARC
jgi:hypothetical protein